MKAANYEEFVTGVDNHSVSRFHPQSVAVLKLIGSKKTACNGLAWFIFLAGRGSRQRYMLCRKRQFA